MTALPNVNDLVQTGISKGTFKAALSSLRAHLYELLGGSGNKADALVALGVPLNSKADKVGAYTVVGTDRGMVMNCSGTFSLSIDDAATLGDGFVFGVLNSGSGTITIDPYLSQQIDGATTKAIGAGTLVLVYCDGEKFTSVGGLDAAAIAAALGYTPAESSHTHAYVSTNMSHGAVGSLCFAGRAADTAYAPGATVAGSSLRPACVTGTSGDASAVNTYGTALSGTWRCLGYCPDLNNSSTYNITLWQRIS